MASAPKRPAKRQRARRAQRPALREEVESEPLRFDEPATPKTRPNPSIEEPTTPGMLSGEPEEACGLPDRAKTRAGDLH